VGQFEILIRGMGGSPMFSLKNQDTASRRATDFRQTITKKEPAGTEKPYSRNRR